MYLTFYLVLIKIKVEKICFCLNRSLKMENIIFAK